MIRSSSFGTSAAVVDEGRITAARPGRVLRGPG
jgi:hypothetical protein